MNFRSLVFLFFVLPVACSDQKVETIEEIELHPVKTETHISDSLNMSGIRDIVVKNDTLFFIDSKSKKIRVLDKSFNYLFSMGRPGKGPGEILYPEACFFNGNSLMLLDIGHNRITHFDIIKRRVIKSVSIPSGDRSSRFSFKNNKYLISYGRKEHPILVFDENGLLIKEMGEGEFVMKLNQGHPRNSMIENLPGNDILAICHNEAIVERYNVHTGTLVQRYNISEFSPLKELYSYNKMRRKDPNYAKTLFGFIVDSNIQDDMLYLLVSSVEKESKHCNTILSFQIEDTRLRARNRYILNSSEKSWYSSFAIDKEYIYCFNQVNQEIQKFIME